MEVVYHLAGVVSILGDAGGSVPVVNVAGAGNAAGAALACGARMVHCSSVHAFDLAAGTGPLDETAPRVPAGSPRHSAYDRSKADGERLVREAIGRGLDAVIVHPTGVIGPWDFEPSRMGRFFIRLWKGTLPALVYGAFDFVDARDVAGGLVAAAERGGRGESYLLGGHFCRIAEIAAVAAAVTGRHHARPTLPMWAARVGVPFMRLAAAAAAHRTAVHRRVAGRAPGRPGGGPRQGGERPRLRPATAGGERGRRLPLVRRAGGAAAGGGPRRGLTAAGQPPGEGPAFSGSICRRHPEPPCV